MGKHKSLKACPSCGITDIELVESHPLLVELNNNNNVWVGYGKLKARCFNYEHCSQLFWYYPNAKRVTRRSIES